MPVQGGLPKRLTYDPSDADSWGAVTLGWTPDGKSVLFNTSSKLYAPYIEQRLTRQLYTAPLSGGLPHLLPVPRATYRAGVRIV